MSVSSEDDFQVNQVVWAKIYGYPWWPARIENIKSSEIKPYKVKFLGENSEADLKLKNIKPYQKYKHIYESKSNREKFKICVLIADNIIKCENNNPEREKYNSPKSDLIKFKEHFDNLKK